MKPQGRWADLIAAMLLIALTLPWLGATTWAGEEGKRALIARTMIETGDFLLPTLDAQPYLAKPPLMNWQIIGSTMLADDTGPFGARLGSLLLLALLCIVVVRVVGRELPGWSLGVLAGALVLQRTLLGEAQAAEIDMQFATLVNLAVWSWYAGWRGGLRGLKLWTLPVIFACLSFLSKGPPGPLFLLLATLAFLATERQLRSQAAGLLGASAVLAAGMFAWGAWVSAQVPPELLQQSMSSELAARFSEVSPGRRLLQPVTMPLTFLVVLLPLSLWLAPLTRASGRRLLRDDQRRLGRFCLAAVAANLPVYFVPDANMRYLLPLTPAMIVLCVLGLEVARQCPPARWLRIACMVILGLGLAIAAAPVINLFIGKPHLLPPFLVAAWALVLFAAAVRAGLTVRRAPATAAGAASLIFLAAVHLADLDLRRQYEIDRDALRRPAERVVADLNQHAGGRAGSVSVVGWIPEDLYLADDRRVLGPRRPEPTTSPLALTLLEVDQPLPAWATAGTIIQTWRYRKNGTMILVARNKAPTTAETAPAAATFP